MNNEKTDYSDTLDNSGMEDILDPHPASPDASDMQKIKKMYLPSSKANYMPSEESIEKANNLQHPKPSSLT